MLDTECVPASPLRRQLWSVLEAPEGKASKFARLVRLGVAAMIVLVVGLSVLETVAALRESFGQTFAIIESVTLALFSVEYALRMWVAGEEPRYSGFSGRLRWMFSFWSIVDLLAILPGLLVWLDIDFRVIRVLRLLRLFRLGRYNRGMSTLVRTFYTSRHQLVVTLSAVLLLLLVASTAVYYAEKDAQPESFASIPHALWWGVCTLTTVGYGDVYPMTVVGRMIAGVVAMLGIGAFAVPAGVVAANFEKALEERGDEEQDRDARGVCNTCGCSCSCA